MTTMLLDDVKPIIKHEYPGCGPPLVGDWMESIDEFMARVKPLVESGGFEATLVEYQQYVVVACSRAVLEDEEEKRFCTCAYGLDVPQDKSSLHCRVLGISKDHSARCIELQEVLNAEERAKTQQQKLHRKRPMLSSSGDAIQGNAVYPLTNGINPTIKAASPIESLSIRRDPRKQSAERSLAYRPPSPASTRQSSAAMSISDDGNSGPSLPVQSEADKREAMWGVEVHTEQAQLAKPSARDQASTIEATPHARTDPRLSQPSHEGDTRAFSPINSAGPASAKLCAELLAAVQATSETRSTTSERPVNKDPRLAARQRTASYEVQSPVEQIKYDQKTQLPTWEEWEPPQAVTAPNRQAQGNNTATSAENASLSSSSPTKASEATSTAVNIPSGPRAMREGNKALPADIPTNARRPAALLITPQDPTLPVCTQATPSTGQQDGSGQITDVVEKRRDSPLDGKANVVGPKVSDVYKTAWGRGLPEKPQPLVRSPGEISGVPFSWDRPSSKDANATIAGGKDLSDLAKQAAAASSSRIRLEALFDDAEAEEEAFEPSRAGPTSARTSAPAQTATARSVPVRFKDPLTSASFDKRKSTDSPTSSMFVPRRSVPASSSVASFMPMPSRSVSASKLPSFNKKTSISSEQPQSSSASTSAAVPPADASDKGSNLNVPTLTKSRSISPLVTTTTNPAQPKAPIPIPAKAIYQVDPADVPEKRKKQAQYTSKPSDPYKIGETFASVDDFLTNLELYTRQNDHEPRRSLQKADTGLRYAYVKCKNKTKADDKNNPGTGCQYTINAKESLNGECVVTHLVLEHNEACRMKVALQPRRVSGSKPPPTSTTAPATVPNKRKTVAEPTQRKRSKNGQNTSAVSQDVEMVSSGNESSDSDSSDDDAEDSDSDLSKVESDDDDNMIMRVDAVSSSEKVRKDLKGKGKVRKDPSAVQPKAKRRGSGRIIVESEDEASDTDSDSSLPLISTALKSIPRTIKPEDFKGPPATGDLYSSLEDFEATIKSWTRSQGHTANRSKKGDNACYMRCRSGRDPYFCKYVIRAKVQTTNGTWLVTSAELAHNDACLKRVADEAKKNTATAKKSASSTPRASPAPVEVRASLDVEASTSETSKRPKAKPAVPARKRTVVVDDDDEPIAVAAKRHKNDAMSPALTASRKSSPAQPVVEIISKKADTPVSRTSSPTVSIAVNVPAPAAVAPQAQTRSTESPAVPTPAAANELPLSLSAYHAYLREVGISTMEKLHRVLHPSNNQDEPHYLRDYVQFMRESGHGQLSDPSEEFMFTKELKRYFATVPSNQS